MTLFELTKALVDIPSVTGSEGPVTDFLAEYLSHRGFMVREQPISGERRNLLATSVDEPRVLLCTHLDTVPPHFASSEDNEFIYGRGACDAKGIVAAMTVAAHNLMQQGVTEVGLLFLVGEETDSIGAKTANEFNDSSEFIVVGEPTDNKMGIGHKGIVTLRLVANGKAVHSAYGHLGESAILKLLDVLQKVRDLEFDRHPVLGETTLNIGKLKGGVAPNVVSRDACAEISFRTTSSSTAIIQAIEETVGDRAQVEIITQSEPQTLFCLPGFEQAVLPYGSDIPHLKRLGQALLLGPGSASVAHTDDERVSKCELLEAVAIYEQVVKQLLAGSFKGSVSRQADAIF
ncbi:M20/M25/M40 family metallo-hydrolase [bacterium]|nr:M20/M25/M40 family metallo-hydrolase [bacterium]